MSGYREVGSYRGAAAICAHQQRHRQPLLITSFEIGRAEQTSRDLTGIAVLDLDNPTVRVRYHDKTGHPWRADDTLPEPS
jgi:hypothetical protein